MRERLRTSRRVALGALAVTVSTGSAAGRPRAARATWIERRAPQPTALSRAERARLLQREPVQRPLAEARNGLRLIGGVAYQVVDAPPARVFARVADLSRVADLLPRTRRATLIDGGRDAARIELVQGNAWLVATYTAHVSVERSARRVSFWLDPSRPHDVVDLWGYFQVAPFGARSSLVSVGALADVGAGLLRGLIEPRVQALILSMPSRIAASVA